MATPWPYTQNQGTGRGQSGDATALGRAAGGYAQPEFWIQLEAMLYPTAYRTLADILVGHSCELKQGDKVLIQASGCDPLFVEVLIEAAYARGALVFTSWSDARIGRAVQRGASDAQLELLGKHEASLMSQMDAYIGVRGGSNIFESSDVPADRREAYTKYVVQPVHYEIRVPKTRWVILRWPTPSMAQQAQMSTPAFEDFFFSACTADYAQMRKDLEPLRELMARTDQVHIKGPGDTDLRFSIKAMGVIPCYGERNIPDGECFTAPHKESVEGVIHYNTPTIYEGQSFADIRLEFKKGRIVKASCGSGSESELNKIFDRDAGARYVGEFSLGVNPHIAVPMRDILFDEKIGGSLHFTPGQAYEVADNGNRSQIHWDLVLVQTRGYGGGEIWFDGKLIRKDGLFLEPALVGLNPR